jgi:hypothetical protein
VGDGGDVSGETGSLMSGGGDDRDRGMSHISEGGDYD